MLFLTAGTVLYTGKMAMKRLHPLSSKRMFHFIQYRKKIRLYLKAAQRPGIQVAKIHTGDEAVVHKTQFQRLRQGSQLIDFPHGFRAEVNVRKAILHHGDTGAG